MIKEAVDRALEGREAIRNAGDDVLNEAQAARYVRVQDASEPARIVGDAVIAAFFSADKPKAREDGAANGRKLDHWLALAGLGSAAGEGRGVPRRSGLAAVSLGDRVSRGLCARKSGLRRNCRQSAFRGKKHDLSRVRAALCGLVANAA